MAVHTIDDFANIFGSTPKQSRDRISKGRPQPLILHADNGNA